MLVAIGVLRLGELQGECLSCRLVATALGVETESSHLVLYLAEDCIGSGWALCARVLQASELLREILLDRFDQVMEVRDVASLFVSRAAARWVQTFRVTASLPLVVQLLALLATESKALLDGLLFALVVRRASDRPVILGSVAALGRRRECRVLAATAVAPMCLVRDSRLGVLELQVNQ